MNRKSSQIIVKHFYSLLPKVGSEKTMQLLVPRFYFMSLVFCWEKMFFLSAAVTLLHILTTPGKLPPCLMCNLNSLLSAPCNTSDDRGVCHAMSSCAAELLHGHLLNSSLIKNTNPMCLFHSQQWPCSAGPSGM